MEELENLRNKLPKVTAMEGDHEGSGIGLVDYAWGIGESFWWAQKQIKMAWNEFQECSASSSNTWPSCNVVDNAQDKGQDMVTEEPKLSSLGA